MAKKQNKTTITILAIVLVVIVVVGIAFLAIASNGSKNKQTSYTVEDSINESEQNRIDAIVEQVKLKAEIHKEEHGYYPYSLRDFIQDPSYLDEYNVVYTRLDDGGGFTITYSGPSGQKTLYSD